MATAALDAPISVPKIDLMNMEVTLVGTSPLICHRWSEKAKKEMLDKQMKKAKTAKEAKDPERDFLDSLYWLTDRPTKMTLAELKRAKFGFPSIAFKAAAVTAAGDVDGAKKTEMRRRFHINDEYVVIQGAPTPREDMCRVGMGTADIRFRGEFREWRTTFVVSFNASAISAEQIVNLFNLAGFGVGIGEWRPEKDGSYGRFRVATQADMK